MHALRSQLLAVLLVGLAVFGIERLIVTDAEAIENLAGEIAQAISDGHYERLEQLLSEDFSYRGKERGATIAHVRGLVEKHKPTGIHITLFDIKIQDDRATASGSVGGTVYGRPVRQRMDAELIRGEDGWLLRRVTGSYGRLP